MEGKAKAATRSRGAVGARVQMDAAYREAMRQAFAEQVTPAVWRTCVGALVKEAQGGNVAAYRLLEPWAMGKAADGAMPAAGGAARFEIVLAGKEPIVVA